MKITMYELLGLIKDNKAPKKIKYYGYVFEYDTNHSRYETFNFDEQKCETLNEYVDINYDLDDEVEIIEETKDAMEKILDEMKEICDVWVKTEGPVKSYTQDQIHCIYDYITDLEKRFNSLLEAHKTCDELEQEKQEIIDKAIKFIKEELFFEDPFGEGEHTFLEDINVKYYEDLLNILQGGDKE